MTIPPWGPLIVIVLGWQRYRHSGYPTYLFLSSSQWPRVVGLSDTLSTLVRPGQVPVVFRNLLCFFYTRDELYGGFRQSPFIILKKDCGLEWQPTWDILRSTILLTPLRRTSLVRGHYFSFLHCLFFLEKKKEPVIRQVLIIKHIKGRMGYKYTSFTLSWT